MIPLNPHQVPSSNLRLINRDGTATNPFYQFITSLFNRGGGANGIINQSAPGLAAAGVDQISATALQHDYNEVLIGSGGVLMKALQPGQTHTIFNGTASAINIYPAVNGQIDSLGNNVAYSLPAGKTQIFTASALMNNGGTQYRSHQLG